MEVSRTWDEGRTSSQIPTRAQSVGMLVIKVSSSSNLIQIDQRTSTIGKFCASSWQNDLQAPCLVGALVQNDLGQHHVV